MNQKFYSKKINKPHKLMINIGRIWFIKNNYIESYKFNKKGNLKIQNNATGKNNNC